MTQIEVNEDTLTVHLDGIDRLLALTRRLDIPLDHLVSVEPKAQPGGSWKGLRALASRIPGALAPGTFHQQRGRGFWEPHKPERTLEISLLDERHSRLVLDVEDARAAAQAIRQACAN